MEPIKFPLEVKNLFYSIQVLNSLIVIIQEHSKLNKTKDNETMTNTGHYNDGTITMIRHG